MRLIVCVKQVPDTNEVKIDPKTGTMIREGVPSILNPDDVSALEEALRIKEEHQGSEVVVITMGPPQAKNMLRECLAMGADSAYLLSDRAFGGADTCATSTTLAAGIRKIGGGDIIFAGRQAIDGDTAQVGPQVAQRLNIPVVTYVQKVTVEEKRCIVERQLEDGYELIETKMPCLLTCVQELNKPRYMSIGGIVDAFEKEITVLTHKELNLTSEDCGLYASPTKVYRSFTPEMKGKGEMIAGGSVSEMSKILVNKLQEKHVL